MIGKAPKLQQDQQINLTYLRNHIGDQSELKNLQDSIYEPSNQDNESRYSRFVPRDSTPPQNRNIFVQNTNTIIIQNVQSETNIGPPPTNDSKQEVNKMQTQMTTQSQSGINLSITSLEINPNKSKWLEFLQNIIFLIALQLVGPFLTTYCIWKYEVLKNLPTKIRVKTFMWITSKAVTASMMMWIMIVTLFMGDSIASPENYQYYKIEFLINIVTMIFATIGGAVLGKNALFNNKFFSELYYLSEQKLKKILNKTQSSSGKLLSQTKTGFLSSLHQNTFSKNLKNTFCGQSYIPEHPLDNFQIIQSEGVFENIQRERKIEERMTKVMKQLYIDSQTFVFSLLPFSLDNPLQQQINESIREKKKSTDAHQKEEQQQEHKNQRNSRFRRLQTVKIQEQKYMENLPEDQANYEQNEDQYNDDQGQNAKINGRKLCNELLIFCEKQESLNPNYFKKSCFTLFLLMKGFLPCFFRLYDGLGFYGDNIIVGIACQMNRQMIYAIFIGFLLFSIDLDIMNSYTNLTNKLIDYTLYLEDNKKDSKDPKNNAALQETPSPLKKKGKKEKSKEKKEKEENQNKQNSSPHKNEEQCIKVEIKEDDIQIELQKQHVDVANPLNSECQQKHANGNNETFYESNQIKDNQIKNDNPKQSKFCCEQKEKEPNKECNCDIKPQSFHEDVKDQEEDDLFGQQNLTPSIDFTDIHSLISWNNMRKLGFHYKQKDIVLIDRISIVFCLELVIIMAIFLLNYFDLLVLGAEYKQTWFIIMILLDSMVVIYTQLNRVHLQTLINKSFLSSVKAIIKVQYLLQQSHLIDVQKHIIINKYKKKDLSKDDQILQFFLKIKSKMLKQEANDLNYYNKIMKVVQFIQNDIKHDLENDQLQFLGLIKATPAFEATLFTSVVGIIYWCFRVYMRYLKVDIGLLGQ